VILRLWALQPKQKLGLGVRINTEWCVSKYFIDTTHQYVAREWDMSPVNSIVVIARVWCISDVCHGWIAYQWIMASHIWNACSSHRLRAMAFMFTHTYRILAIATIEFMYLTARSRVMLQILRTSSDTMAADLGVELQSVKIMSRWEREMERKERHNDR